MKKKAIIVGGMALLLTGCGKEKNELLGTWEVYGQGRVLIGSGSNGTTTYTAGNTGESESVSTSHTHNFTWSGAHAHQLPIFRRNSDNYLFIPWNISGEAGHTANTSFASDGIAINYANTITISGSTTYSGVLRYNSSNALVSINADTATGGGNVDVRQPYVVVYMYRRTA